LRPTLDTTVNVVTLIAGVAILGTLVARAVTPVAKPIVTQPFQVGEHVPQFRGLNFARAKRTLLMVVRQDCKFCGESIPFYRRLPRSGPVTLGGTQETQLVVLTEDDLNTARHFVEGNSLMLDAVVAIPPARRSDLRVKGTPTLLLVDSAGTIKKIWIGKLSENREREVIDALTNGN
jgi:hypothetical protein